MARPVDRFVDLCKEKFQFLVDEFGCQVITGKVDKRFGGDVIYQNTTSAVRVHYDAFDGVLAVILARLVDGKAPPYGDLCNGRPLWTVLRLRASDAADAWDRREERTEAGLEAALGDDAASVRAFAADILGGDFSSFPELEGIRAEEFRGRPPGGGGGGAPAP